jgi:hypothetical protein
MLLDNCGDKNRKNPATNHPMRERKKPLICNLAKRERVFTTGVLGTPKLCSHKFFVAAHGYNADGIIDAPAKVISAYAIGTRTAAFAAAR